ncbi:putative WPP domain-interacting protein/3 [Helianthus annuus]|nr:putative WPP domain-interacting protein/3 [Helianthus annuus]
MKRKIEVEVQHVAISKAIEHWNVEYEVMVVEQKKVLLEQVEMMKKLEDAEEKAMELKMQAEKLQVICEEILEKEQEWEARNMVWRFCVKLMILFVLLVFFFFFGV